MLKFLVKRILFFIPVLLAVTLLAFSLSTLAPVNPLDKILISEKTESSGVQSSELQKRFWIKKLGLDLPIFYLSIEPLSYSKDLNGIYDKQKRKNIETLIDQTGNAPLSFEYYSSTENLAREAKAKNALEIYRLTTVLQNSSGMEESKKVISALLQNGADDEFSALSAGVESKFAELSGQKTKWKNYIPAVRFHSVNRFHQWLFGNNETDEFKAAGILRGDFGISFVTRQPVLDIIRSRLPWTVFFSLGSVLIAYVISIPVGVACYLKNGSFFEKFTARLCFALMSLPVFVIAIGLIYMFSNPDFINVLPSSGIKPAAGYASDDSGWQKFKTTLPYLILPMACYTYSSFAFLTLLTKNLVSDASEQQYMLTARAKGLSRKSAVFRHALKNSLLPLITVFVNVFPSLLAGSVVLETIFTIPGMGYQAWYAIQNQDYPVVTCTVFLTGLLTVIGFLVSDILYCMADPRISLTQKK